MAFLFSDPQSLLQSASKAWSFKELDPGSSQILRFEVRPGDHWRSSDGSKERAEVSSDTKLDFGKTYTLTYGFMLEPGSKSSEDNVKIGQLHGTPDANDSSNLGPVFAIQLDGERMRIVTRADGDASTDSRVDDNFVYTDKSDIDRGHWYDMKIVFKLDPQGHGLLDVWRDDDQLVHYTGALGYNDDVGPYWKEGLYRPAGDVTMAADYRDTTLVEGTTASPHPPSSPVPPTPVDPPAPPTAPTPPASTPLPPVTISGDGVTLNGVQHVFVGTATTDSIDSGDHNDVIYADGLSGALGGSDAVDAGKGNDLVYSGFGSDYVLGGAGGDTIFGGGGNDTINGGAGNDVLIGQAGHDTFVFSSNFGRDVIQDFSARDHDLLNFAHGIFDNYADLSQYMAQDGSNVVITDAAHDTLTLIGVDVSAMTADHFLFS